MGTKRPKKALLEMIPPRICITFRRGSFWFRPKTSKMRIWKPRPENTTNTVSGSRPDFSEKSENHENRLELDPYSTSRAENQAIWNLKVLWIQWDPSGTPKLPYKIQNRPKIQWIQPGTVYTKLFRQPYEHRFQNWLGQWWSVWSHVLWPRRLVDQVQHRMWHWIFTRSHQ